MRHRLERLLCWRESAERWSCYQHMPPVLILAQLWIKRYREKGLSGLANHVARSDKGKSRRLPMEAIRLIEGLALQTPPRLAASIHRQVSTIAKEQGWPTPSYHRVYTIIKKLDPALVTLATREPQPIERSSTCSTGERRLTPMPCGRPIIPRSTLYS